jgi:hypothetical protein
VFKRFIASTFVGAVLSTGVSAAAAVAPAAASPIVTGGLVNITVVDVLSHNDVQVAVPIEVAASLCGVNVNVLSEQVQAIDCRHRTTQDVEVAFRT